MQRIAIELGDLPQELRDIIYALAMNAEEEPRLVAGPTGTAKALSQVSRNVRADATRIFFSENSCLAIVCFATSEDRKAGRFKTDSGRVGAWAETWGALASPHIRSLNLVCGGFRKCRQRISVKPREDVKPVKFCGSSECYVSLRIRERDVNELALAVFDGHGEQRFTFERLALFLTAVEDVVGQRLGSMKEARVAEIVSEVKQGRSTRE